MTRTLLTGATGRLGDRLRPRLREAGHDVVAASRSPPTDRTGRDSGTATSEGSTEWVVQLLQNPVSISNYQ